MNKTEQKLPKNIEPFPDRVSSLFCEVELATRWDRPSILFTVCCSDYIRAEVQTELEKHLSRIDQKVQRLSGKTSPTTPLLQQMELAHAVGSQVIFIEEIECSNNACENTLYKKLNACRDTFVEKNMRVIFWLTEKELYDLANAAPDLWAYRHGLVEFPDTPEPEKILARTLEAAWENLDETQGLYQTYGTAIGMPGALLNEIPQGEKTSGIYINLLLTLGILHWRKRDYAKADEFIKAAIEIAEVINDPKLLAECLNALALVRIGQKKPEDAVAAYLRSLETAPQQVFPWNNLANLYSKLGRDHEAISAFKKALQQNINDSFGWNGMADIYARLKIPATAIEHYQKALELTPTFVPAWVGLGCVYAQSGENEKAKKALLKAIELDSKNSDAWLELAKLQLSTHNTDEAVKSFKKVLELEPDNIEALRALGELYLKTGKTEAAIAAFRSAIALQPDSGIDYSSLGFAHSQSGNLNEAILLYKKSLKLDATPATKALTANRLGDAYRTQGEYQKAMDAYKAADQLAGDPSSAPEPAPIISEVIQPEAATVPPAPAQSGVCEFDEPDMFSFEKAAMNDEAEHWLAGNNINATGQEQHYYPTVTDFDDTFTPVTETENEADFTHFWEEQIVFPTEQAEVVKAPDGTESEIFDLVSDTTDDTDNEDSSEEATYWNNLGNQYLQMGEYNEAIAAYTRAIETSPTVNWPCIKNLAVANYLKGKVRGAQTTTPETDIKEEDDDQRAGTEIAPSHKTHEEEATLLSELPNGETNNTPMSKQLNQLGNEYMKNGEYVKASEAFIKAIDLDPEFGWAYCNLGLAYFQMEKNTYAILSIKRGIDYLQGDKEKAIAWRHLSDIYTKVGDTYNAKKAIDEAVALEKGKFSLLERARSVIMGNVTML